MPLWNDFFGSFKTEWMPKYGYSNFEEAGNDTLNYILKHYNIRLGHSYNNYLSPTAARAVG
jgi:putative transposase